LTKRLNGQTVKQSNGWLAKRLDVQTAKRHGENKIL
jgi:hypothetical protein